MVRPDETAEPRSPDAALPPVEAPTGGYFVKLFLVPAAIVGVIVLGWMGCQKIAGRTADPERLLRTIEGHNAAYWQAAHDLADLLRDPRNAALRRDAKLATQVGQTLQREIEIGSWERDDVDLRIYLCRVLGSFVETEAAVAPLAAALAPLAAGQESALRAKVESERSIKSEQKASEIEVRRNGMRMAALQGLADTLAASPQLDRGKFPELRERIVAALAESEPSVVRSAAVMALGSYGGDEALAELRGYLRDANADVRYNAALRLALLHRDWAVPVLVRMLDPDERAATELETDDAAQRNDKRHLVIRSALQAAHELATKADPNADLEELRPALKLVADSERLPDYLREGARQVLKELDGRPPRRV